MRECRVKEATSQLFLLAMQFFLLHTGRESFGVGASIVAAEESNVSDYSSGPNDEEFGLLGSTSDQEISNILSTNLPQSEEQDVASTVDQETSENSVTILPQDGVSSEVTGEADQPTFEIQSTSFPGDEESGEVAGATDQQTSDIQSTNLPHSEEYGELAGDTDQQTSDVLSSSLLQNEEYGEGTIPTDQQTSDTHSTSQQTSGITPPNVSQNEVQVQRGSQESQHTAGSSPPTLSHGAQGQMADRINEIKQQMSEMHSVFLDPLAQITRLVESHSLSLTAEQHLHARACCKSGSTSCPEGCAIKKSNKSPSTDTT